MSLDSIHPEATFHKVAKLLHELLQEQHISQPHLFRQCEDTNLDSIQRKWPDEVIDSKRCPLFIFPVVIH